MEVLGLNSQLTHSALYADGVAVSDEWGTAAPRSWSSSVEEGDIIRTRLWLAPLNRRATARRVGYHSR